MRRNSVYARPHVRSSFTEPPPAQQGGWQCDMRRAVCFVGESSFYVPLWEQPAYGSLPRFCANPGGSTTCLTLNLSRRTNDQASVLLVNFLLTDVGVADAVK